MPVIHQTDQQIHQQAYQRMLADGCADGNRLLSVDQLSFSYPDGHPALHDVSICIAQGEKAALVGPNGAGKSTLMLHLNGILSGKGQVQVGGMQINKKNLPSIRAMVGMVFQNPDDQLFSPTVYEDVAFGPLHMGLPEDEIARRVSTALEQVGMSRFANRLSHHLSTGEKKRIAIATVLSMDPQILVLDEPSAGLDPRARRSLINLLHDLPLTQLVSTHDLLMVRELFPRTIIMDEGRVVADGPTEALLADPSLLEEHGLELP
jgi:cobalt/nickel transport system ATP-binding protein